MNRFYSRLGRSIVRYRWIVVLFWVALVLVSSRALPSLGSQINNDNSQFLPASSPSQQASNLAIPLLGDTNNYSQVFVVAARSSGPLTANDATALRADSAELRSIHKVVGVRELAVSKSRQATEILVNAKINQSNIVGEQSLITAIEATFARTPPPAGLQLHLAGSVASNVANQNKSNKTGGTTQTFTLLFIVVLLLVIFRSVLAPLITLLPSAIALLVAGRFIGGLGAHGLKISEITQLLLIVLMLGAGTDYGLFLVFRVREELRGGRSPNDAVAHALFRIGESITASAGTVMFALLSLLLASFGIYHDLGIPLAIGVGVMLLAGLTLLPALLAIFGRRLFWPSNVEPSEQHSSGWARIATRLLRRPAWTLAIGIMVFAALAGGALSFKSGGFGGAVNAPNGTDAAQGNALLLRYFPQASTNPTNLIVAFSKPVWEHPSSLQRIETDLRSSGLFRSLEGPLNANGSVLTPTTYARLHQQLGSPLALPFSPPNTLSGPSLGLYDAYRSTAFFVSANGKVIQFEANLKAGNAQSNPAIDAVPAIRAELTKAGRAGGASATGVAGIAPALYDVNNTSNHDLTHVIPIAILAIGLLLGIVLRSAVAPLYLIVSVALSYFAALGVSTIVFIDIAGDRGISFILPFLMFIFLLALGEDYNILVMTRIREEAHARSLKEAVIIAVARTGPTITSAGLVLAGTFAVFAIAGTAGPGGNQIEAIGFGLAIGVLMDTFLVRTLLVPATVTLLGRWNWWPAKMGKRDADRPEEEAVGSLPEVLALESRA